MAGSKDVHLCVGCLPVLKEMDPRESYICAQCVPESSGVQHTA